MRTATSSDATTANLSGDDILRWIRTSDGPTAIKSSVDDILGWSHTNNGLEYRSPTSPWSSTKGQVGDFLPIRLKDQNALDSLSTDHTGGQLLSAMVASMYDEMFRGTEDKAFYFIDGELRKILTENGITSEEQQSSLKSFLGCPAGSQAADARSKFDRYVKDRADVLGISPVAFFDSCAAGHETFQSLFIDPQR